MPLVGVIMGSKSDWEVMREAVDILKNLGLVTRPRLCLPIDHLSS